LRSVLNKIFPDQIAAAAYRSQNFERALRYHENYIRKTRSAAIVAGGHAGDRTVPNLIPLAAYLDDDGFEVSTTTSTTVATTTHKPAATTVESKAAANHVLNAQLQTIYVHLDEQDGMAGIAALFRPNYPVDQQISDHRSHGRWSDAQTCYELALEQSSSATTARHLFQFGQLECLQHLGHFRTL